MKTPTNSIIFPVAIWGWLQLMLLGIGASRFPLWAHHPLPRESKAIEELVCGQMIFIAMLFPILGKSAWALSINLVLMLSFDELAGLLSNTPQRAILHFVAVVGLWLAGLASWRLGFKDDRVYQTAMIVAVFFTVGGAMFDYFRWESSLAGGDGGHFSTMSMLPMLCETKPENAMRIWLEATMPLVLFIVSYFPSTLLHKHRKVPSTSLHIAP